MFITHKAFKLPIQFGGEETYWRNVELTLRTPLYLVTTEDPKEPVSRDFLLGSESDLTNFIMNRPAGRSIGMSLVLPPGASGADAWQMIPIRRVERQQRDDGGRAEVILTAKDGRRYGGSAEAQADELEGPLVPMAEFA